MIGMAHEFQLNDETRNPWMKEFRDLLLNVMKAYPMEIILEEWSNKRGISIGKSLESGTLEWRKISPPPTPEYCTEDHRIGQYGPEVPEVYLSLRQYSFEQEENRESYMVSSITEAMQTRSKGLVIVGMNHIHSLMGKLRDAGFEVIAQLAANL
jgi:hypothetical protein